MPDYWVLNEVLPGVGTGFRRVEARVGRKWAYVRACGSGKTRFRKVPLAVWAKTPHASGDLDAAYALPLLRTFSSNRKKACSL